MVVLDEADVGAKAAELVADRLAGRPDARLLLPTGRTPGRMYAALRAHEAAAPLATVLQLDEYVGLAPDDSRSFAATLRRELRGVPVGGLRTIDGAAADLAAEAARHAAVLAAAPIDLAVLGLGANGHVAFNEPPADLTAGVKLVELADTTRRDNADAFGSIDAVPRHALTTAIGTLAAARELLVLVTGAAKAPALRAMLEEPAGPWCPASLLRDHGALTVLCDADAASLLSGRAAAAASGPRGRRSAR